AFRTSLTNSLNSYVPGVVGIVTVHVRLVTPTPTGVCCREMLSGAPVAARASESVAPPKPLASVTVTSAPGATRVALGVNVAGGSIVKGRADDVPPPGEGVDTLTRAPPTLAISAAAIWAISCLALTTFVGRGDPFHRATEKAS